MRPWLGLPLLLVAATAAASHGPAPPSSGEGAWGWYPGPVAPAAYAPAEVTVSWYHVGETWAPVYWSATVAGGTPARHTVTCAPNSMYGASGSLYVGIHYQEGDCGVTAWSAESLEVWFRVEQGDPPVGLLSGVGAFGLG